MEIKRNTLQRRIILGALKEMDTHATAEQVCEHVLKEHPTISKATVYRNLAQLSAAGELLDIGSFRGATHYDHRTHKHYHFICDGCGRVFDVQKYFPELSGQSDGLEGFEVRGHSLVYKGLCPDCKEETNA